MADKSKLLRASDTEIAELKAKLMQNDAELEQLRPVDAGSAPSRTPQPLSELSMRNAGSVQWTTSMSVNRRSVAASPFAAQGQRRTASANLAGGFAADLAGGSMIDGGAAASARHLIDLGLASPMKSAEAMSGVQELLSMLKQLECWSSGALEEQDASMPTSSASYELPESTSAPTHRPHPPAPSPPPWPPPTVPESTAARDPSISHGTASCGPTSACTADRASGSGSGLGFQLNQCLDAATLPPALQALIIPRSAIEYQRHSTGELSVLGEGARWVCWVYGRWPMAIGRVEPLRLPRQGLPHLASARSPAHPQRSRHPCHVQRRAGGGQGD